MFQKKKRKSRISITCWGLQDALWFSQLGLRVYERQKKDYFYFYSLSSEARLVSDLFPLMLKRNVAS